MRIAKLLLVVVLAIVFAAAFPGVSAFAAGGTTRSCMGWEASSVSPPGSTDEAPGGMREFTPFFKAVFPGSPPGASYSFIASLHEGSHLECDEVLEGGE